VTQAKRGQARFGVEESRQPLPLRRACQKPLTRRSACFSTQAGRLHALRRHRNVWLPLCRSAISIIQLCRSLAVLLCFSFAGQAEAIRHRSRESTDADHHYIFQPRSSRVTTRGRSRTGHPPSGGAGHSYAHSTFSQPTPIHGTFAAFAGGEAFRSRPLRHAESHVHDCPVALGAHREAASLEHIQHRDIFRKDLGDELMKSGFTAEGCEMAHQR
jgi:hypothetical protein